MLSVVLFLVFVACKNNNPAPDYSEPETAPETAAESDADTVKILGIGNSFTVDAMEKYINELAKADGKIVITAYAAIGAATLEKHLQNAKSGEKAYQYVKRGEDGSVAAVSGKSIEDCVLDEKWDYIFFQQQSFLSGVFESYRPYIANLVQYVKSKSRNPGTIYCLLQTWAYAYDSPPSGFEYYNNNQLVMFTALANAANKASKLVEPEMMIIPAGTAIQNGRTSVIGDEFCRDGYHLNDTGRFAAACTIYESIFKSGNIKNNSYKPQNMPDNYADIVKTAAYYAVTEPDIITDLSEAK